MELKKEILTAFQLLALLCLLYWSCTWNLPSNYDPFQENVRNVLKRAKEDLYPKGFHHPVLHPMKSVESVSYRALKISSTERTLLPPFYAWKEEELTKHEVNILREKKQKKPFSKRKLNYASSKCGAKILLSNPEAKYRMAILNENEDDYMLNLCRVNAWFVAELCDTIQATQIELANYELYSSSPKKFSTFWSDVYPTQRWNHLGSFEAKDKRSIQTFYLTEQNLGKFIKVIINSHHGKEHYCPLSLLRVLGYSMIYEYDDSIEKDDSQETISTERGVGDKVKGFDNRYEKTTEEKHKFNFRLSKNLSLCKMYLKHCPDYSKTHLGTTCLNQPFCTFLKSIIPNTQEVRSGHMFGRNCHQFFSQAPSTKAHRNRKPSNSLPQNSSNLQDFIFPKSHNRTGHSLLQKISPNIDNNSVNKTSNISYEYMNTAIITEGTSGVEALKSGKNIRPQSKSILEQKYTTGSFEEMATEEVSVSAALIQKESVLSKLTNRIRASEMNLNLVNRYLQQLSESYQQQMENMQIMFNSTMKAIVLASDKAAAVDEQQERTIENLERKMNALNNRVEYFVDGHHEVLKRVLELHGFFLILECIVISTIFSIFLNSFKQNKRHKTINILE